MTVRGVLAGDVKLTLQVLLSDLQIAQSHANVFVPQQLHEGGETDAQAEHFTGEGVSELVRAHWMGAAGSFRGVG